eukprot:TRINITY_DN21702_c0_g1_i1.p1 TRINITY_DN21702_c0_g1~~TRINITY_DN21702_c0_g1_i1.p1  ORF type:complete len:1337 (+),score=209.97 TRINITY_DN21702_c0_g1_i1:517-4011(+)
MKLKTATYLMLLRKIIQFCVRNAVYSDDLFHHIINLVYFKYDLTRPLSEVHTKPFKDIFNEKKQEKVQQELGRSAVSRENNRNLINQRCKRGSAEHILKLILFRGWWNEICNLKIRRVSIIARLATIRNRFTKHKVLSAWKTYHRVRIARSEEAKEGQQKLHITNSEARRLSIIIEQQQLEIAQLKNKCSDFQRELSLSQNEIDQQHQQLVDFEQESLESIKQEKRDHVSEISKLQKKITELQTRVESQSETISHDQSHTFALFMHATGNSDNNEEKAEEQVRPYAKEFLNELQDPSDESLPLEFLRWCMRQLTTTKQQSVDNLTTSLQDGEVFSHVALYCFPEACHATILKMIDSRRRLQKVMSILQLYGHPPPFSVEEIIGGNSTATAYLSLLILECWVNRRNMLSTTPSSSCEPESLSELFTAYQEEKNTWSSIINPSKEILNRKLFERVHHSDQTIDDSLIKDKLLFTKLRSKVQLSSRGETPVIGEHVNSVLRNSIESIRLRNLSSSKGRGTSPNTPNTPTKLRSPTNSGRQSPTKIKSPPVAAALRSSPLSPTERVKSPPVVTSPSDMSPSKPPIGSNRASVEKLPSSLKSPPFNNASSPTVPQAATRISFEGLGEGPNSSPTFKSPPLTGKLVIETNGLADSEEPKIMSPLSSKGPVLSATRVSIEEPLQKGNRPVPLNPDNLLSNMGGSDFEGAEPESDASPTVNEQDGVCQLPIILSPECEPTKEQPATASVDEGKLQPLPSTHDANSPRRGLSGGDVPQPQKLANSPDIGGSLAPVKTRKRALSTLQRSREGPMISPTNSTGTAGSTKAEGRKRSGTVIGNSGGPPTDLRPSTSHGLLSATMTSDGSGSVKKKRGSLMPQLNQIIKDMIGVEDFSPSDVMRLEELLVNNFSQLRNIFKYYSRLTSKSDEMTVQEFVKLMGDCHVLDTSSGVGQVVVGARQVGTVQIEVLLSRIRNCGSSSSNQNSKKKEESYGPQFFTEFLIRVAQYRYSKICTSVGDRFEKLLSVDILPNALWSEVDEFRTLFYQPKMQRVLNDFKSRLHKVFHHYIQDKRTGHTMSSKDFWQMLSESKMCGESVSQYDALVIYNNSHRSEELSIGDAMTFGEFLEGITGVALCKNSVLILPPSHRLRDFLTKFHTALGVANPRLRTGSVGVR